MKRSGDAPFEFIYRDDLHVLPGTTIVSEVNLHGGFAADRRAGFGQIYYGMPDQGVLRIGKDLRSQELITLPEQLKPMNFHSTKIGEVGGNVRLFLAANNDSRVAVLTLEGKLDFVLSKPEFAHYLDDDTPFAPTDTVQVGDQLFVADGYGSNYISTADLLTQKWNKSFGGKTEDPEEQGRFGTAHGINKHFANSEHLLIADRPHSRIQVHDHGGGFLASHNLPAGSWPCGIDFLDWRGSWLAVIGSLLDPIRERPAPIYIVDASTYQVLSTIRPKEELGIDPVQHVHNVVWHVHQGQLYLVCQSWNPGYYFVLELV